ncbi:hypothetical protein [Labrenzia sp. OB1]|uniref:hypothetical protein n=1 Tax=Labrenzia sp. OB1 TaxID=1561204 RepID=UPI0012E83361|nr:hypothetical protein [Labrenzia sp. OB1]
MSDPYDWEAGGNGYQDQQVDEKFRRLISTLERDENDQAKHNRTVSEDRQKI